MPLEDAIKENTKAVEKLTEALTQFAASGNGAAAPTVAAKEEKPAAKKGETKKEKKKDAPAPESEKYLEEVKPATLKAIKTLGRDRVAEVLVGFVPTAKSAKDLLESQYDDYLAKIEEVLAEDEEDLT